MSKKIKNIKTYFYSKETETDKTLSSVKEYDENGNQILFKEFDDNESLMFEQRISYKDKNKPIVEININIIDGYTETITSTYSDNGELLSEKVENDNGWWYTKKYETDKSTKTTTISIYDEDDNLEEKTILKYNEKGKLISQIELDEDENIKETTKYEYDENDVILSKYQFLDSNKPERIVNYFYDEANDLTDIQVLNRKEKLIDWSKLAYNENHQLIEQIGMSGTRHVYEYNEENKSIKETSYNNGGEILETQTSYKNEDGLLIKEHFLSSSLFKEYEYEYF